MIKWPKSNDTTEWTIFDEHLSNLLHRTLHGSAEAKLNLYGEIPYKECRGKYGELTFKKPVARTKGRREKEIKKLMTSRRKLRKRWRRADKSEKEGLKVLWDEIKGRLASGLTLMKHQRWTTSHQHQ